MDTKALKDKILQLAIQGKLVPQDPADEPASVLLERIKAEKEQLIRDKKIKKDKPLPEIAEEEKPFKIPDGWEWVRLNEICYNLGQKKPDETFTYIDVSSIDNEKGELKNEFNLISPEKAPSRARKLVQKGTVIYSTVRPYLLNIAIVNKDFEFPPIVSTAFAVMHPFEGVNNHFLFYYLRSSDFLEFVNSQMVGIAYPAINDSNLFKGLFPLPPLYEQKRIVEKVDQLFSLIDSLDADKDELIKAIKLTRSKVLQEAIQGRLVEQDPDDEPASALLERIRVEKEQLVKDKKIKKEKPLPEIAEDEKPFEIPDGWEWVRLGEIVSVKSSKRIFAQEYQSYGVPFFRSKEVGELVAGKETTSELYISTERYEEIKEKYGVPSKGDILLTSVGTIGNTWVVDERQFYYKDGNITQLENNKWINTYYVKHFIGSTYFTDETSKTVSGTAYNALTIEKINKIRFPLPPLYEQKRIVEKVDAIMRLCDELEAQII